MPGCFAAVWTKAGDRSSAHVFSTSPPFALPGCHDIQFDPQFPRAILKDADVAQPVSLGLRAYSSLVPQDLKNSAVPAAVFLFTVKNETSGPVEISVALSWENFLGVGGTAAGGAQSDRAGNRVETIPPAPGLFGLRMASADKQTVDPANRLYYNARGTYALLAAPSTPEAFVTTAGWNAVDRSPSWWKGFQALGVVEGEVGKGVEGKVHPAGVVAVKVTLKEKEMVELPFAVSWHTPRLYTLDGTEYGHYYEKSFDDATEAGRYALDNRQSTLALIDEWQNRLLRSSFPPAFVRRVLADASLLFTHSILTKSSGQGGTDPGPFRFFILDTGGSSHLGGLDRRFGIHPLLSAWFPQLDELELAEYMTRRSASGELRRFIGALDSGPAGETPSGAISSPADAASYLFQVAARYRGTGDQKFLDRFYPSAKHVVEAIGSNGPAIAANVTPIARERDRLLWIAACTIARSLAVSMNDKGFEAKCAGWLDKEEREKPASLTDTEALAAAAEPCWLAELAGAQSAVLSRAAQRIVARLCGADVATLTNELQSAIAGLGAETRVTGAETITFSSSLAARTEPACAQRWLNAVESTSTAGAFHAYVALIGARVDLPAGILEIAPQLPPNAKTLTAPLFTPTFWASLEYRVALTSSLLSVRIDRFMPARPVPKVVKNEDSPPDAVPPGLLLKEIVVPQPPERPGTEVVASVGRAPVAGNVVSRGQGRVTFRFSAPISLAVGQTLTIRMR
jgi:hypothetical protein